MLRIIKQPSWYNCDKEKSQRIVWMLAYGIFRGGYNTWMHDVSENWMKGFTITYKDYTENLRLGSSPTWSCQSSEHMVDQRPGKGFVYKILISRASNTIANAFQNATTSAHSEYICVREKKHKVDSAGYEKVKLTFGTNSAF